MKYLLFQCYAPLVSWGEIAIGKDRHSSRQPSKSAIIGLLAAAMGIRRDDVNAMDAIVNSVGFAVKMFSGGTVLKDFHTAQVPKTERKVFYHTRRDETNAPQEKIKTVLSSREYRCDSLSVIAVWLNGSTYSAEQLKQALQEPVFAPYFGRKSCPPAVPLNPEVLDADSIRDAFSRYKVVLPLPIADNASERAREYFDGYQLRALQERNTTYFWEKCDHSGFEETHKTPRYDLPLSRKRWQFTCRDEYMTVDAEKEADSVS
ncbi:CRISPR-associated protein Cas5/CasD [Chitinispirillum alkaliphilum]|nr:CRISPR-associated protein Cas5/CasD [Chitinispirillum alkaliphilum]